MAVSAGAQREGACSAFHVCACEDMYQARGDGRARSRMHNQLTDSRSPLKSWMLSFTRRRIFSSSSSVSNTFRADLLRGSAVGASHADRTASVGRFMRVG